MIFLYSSRLILVGSIIFWRRSKCSGNSFLFLFFYLVLLKSFLSKISIIIKLRIKKFIRGGSFSESSVLEVSNTYNQSAKLLVGLCSSFRYSLLKNFENYDAWLFAKSSQHANLKKFQALYLISNSRISLKKAVL